MTPTGDGWWRWDRRPTRHPRPAGDRLRLRARRCRAGPARPAQRLAAARRARPEPHLRREPPSPGPTTAGADPVPAQACSGSVVYELHVGTFTPEGTLDAAVARLDHLVDLGVDVVELMPVAAFPGRWGWGYDGVDLWAVHDGYGGPAALQRFVDACHARGLGVALDVVHNHLGASGNYLARFGPYFTEAHHTPWGPAVNLDHAGCGRGAALPRRERAALVPRLPRRRPAPRRRARAQGRLAAALPRRALRRRGRPVDRARAPARPRRRERPQRHLDGDADGRGRPGDDGPVGRRRAPRPARGAHRRGARLLRRLRRRRRPRRGRTARRARQGAHPRVPPRRHHVDLPRPARGAARSTSSTSTRVGSWATCRPTTRSATG